MPSDVQSAQTRTDIAYIVNTTPKYFFMLNAHFALLRRYQNTKSLKWLVALGTEEPDDPAVKKVYRDYGVTVIPLTDSESDFWESRLATVRKLPSSIKYILPAQEDFLLERPGVDWSVLQTAVETLDADSDVLSVRLMPCPGPVGLVVTTGFAEFQRGVDEYLFTFQATLWRREAYERFFKELIERSKKEFNMSKRTGTPEYNRWQVSVNYAERDYGIQVLYDLYPKGKHLGVKRKGTWANAVYLCPWPYRPTAIVKGVLEWWAKELCEREGVPLNLKN